jgi:putative component of membrane protein insertase Oxa1/YidC/SpoIIIJ protein YidD
MLSYPPPNRLRQTLAGTIGLYQKYLSPHKGFSCAYRIQSRGSSCSQYCKEMILERGPIGAISPVRQRFQDCKQAANRIQAQRLLSQGYRLQDHRQFSDNSRRSDSPKKQRTGHIDSHRSNGCYGDPCPPDCLLLGCDLLTPGDACDFGGAECLSGADCCSCSF